MMVPVCKAVERIILERHPASLEPEALAILHKFPAVRAYVGHELTDLKAVFTKLVPEWKELNRALFWFELQRTREAVNQKHGERSTDFRQVLNFESFWQFEQSDFEYLASEVSSKTLLDDRLIALSLAFDLYKKANGPKAWLERLKKFVAGNEALSVRLKNYLNQPAQGKIERQWKQQEAKWKRIDEARKKKQEKYHAGWKRYFDENLNKLKAELIVNPGVITNALFYLFNQAQRSDQTSTRWTEYNWKTLIKEYGEDVAQFYKEGTVAFWRHHEPTLRSEGAPFNKTSYDVIIGLVGLEIEATETKGWPKNLNNSEAERACRYALFELNGFPSWLPKLFEVHSKIVCNFLMQEVKYELMIEKAGEDSNYIIGDLSWSGQWAWDQMGPHIYDALKREPKNITNLENLVKIIQGSSISDELIENLASLKCRTLINSEHAARWFAVWIGVSPDTGIAAFKKRISAIADTEHQTLFAMTLVTHLWGFRRVGETSVRKAFQTPKHLKSLYLLMHEHIRSHEDIIRINTGCYSPGMRDNAQEARDGLFRLLNQIPGKESFLALNEIAEMHPDEACRPWILLHAKTRAEQDGDIQPWSPSQVKEFNNKFERTPRNHRELAELAVLRLLDLKDDLEHGDSSIAAILKNVELETEMRNYIGKELREKALGRYSIPQEEELADAKSPDLRFHGINFDGPVPVELKIAEKWSGPKLFERLENQLCGDYLRDTRSNRGIFMLVYQGKISSKWDLPETGKRVDFAGLASALQEHWQLISTKFPRVDEVTVIGIDLTKRSN